MHAGARRWHIRARRKARGDTYKIHYDRPGERRRGRAAAGWRGPLPGSPRTWQAAAAALSLSSSGGCWARRRLLRWWWPRSAKAVRWSLPRLGAPPGAGGGRGRRRRCAVRYRVLVAEVGDGGARGATASEAPLHGGLCPLCGVVARAP